MIRRTFLALLLALAIAPAAAQTPSASWSIVLRSTGDPAADTAAIEQAVAAGYRDILLDGRQPWRLLRTIVLQAGGQTVRGVSRRATSVEWCGDPADATAFRLRRQQEMRVTTMTIRPCRMGQPDELVATGGAAVVIEPAALPDGTGAVIAPGWSEVSDLWVMRLWDGVHVLGATETRLKGLRLWDLRGWNGVLIRGTAAHRVYRVVIEDMVGGGPTHGGVVWVNQNSYAYSVVLDRAALVQGGVGVRMADDVAAGDSYPMWLFAYDLETDHTAWHGVDLQAGEGFLCSVCWLGSSVQGFGAVAHSAWRGDLTITGSRVYGNGGHGVALLAGRGAHLAASLVGDNGTLAPGVYSGVLVGAGTRATTILGSTIGDLVGVAGNAQGWGVAIEAGADEVVAIGNVLTGNRAGPLWNGGAGQRSVLGLNVQ